MGSFAIISALLPIFGLVLLGYFFKQKSFPDARFWPMADRLIYFVLFPSLVVDKLSTLEVSRPELLPMTLVLVGSVILISGAVMIWQILTQTPPPIFTSVLQASIRPNTYVGLAGAGALFGSEGITLTALSLASVIPLVNVISVYGFVAWMPSGRGSIKNVFKNLLSNPILIACAIGLSLGFSSFDLPSVAQEILRTLGRAALPMGLMSVGAGLVIRQIGEAIWPIIGASFLKLILVPSLVALACIYLGIEGVTKAVVILYAAVPCSVSSYTLSAQLGGDAQLMASIITVQTLLAMLTISLVLGFWL